MAGTQQAREVTVACRTCRAYGILITEGESVATICVACKGRGFQRITFEPFTGRKKMDGITRVRRAGEGLSPFGRSRRKRVGIPYREFLKGKLP